MLIGAATCIHNFMQSFDCNCSRQTLLVYHTHHKLARTRVPAVKYEQIILTWKSNNKIGQINWALMWVLVIRCFIVWEWGLLKLLCIKLRAEWGAKWNLWISMLPSDCFELNSISHHNECDMLCLELTWYCFNNRFSMHCFHGSVVPHIPPTWTDSVSPQGDTYQHVIWRLLVSLYPRFWSFSRRYGLLWALDINVAELPH